jgi:cyclopropane fatty-acyl-phospholipid synthase-like methyltransferase
MSKPLYDDSFYSGQIDGSYRSASLYAGHLVKIADVKSVADVGCGRGTWLKAFGDRGATRLVGFDGDWNSQEKMVDQSIEFIPVDLNGPLMWRAERFDLAISLEVAEHLKPESSSNFVKNIASLSDVIVFGAAFTKQGGHDHINERAHTFWAKKFMDSGYTPYDVFRSSFWGDREVEFWYQQNTFLYVKTAHRFNQKLHDSGYKPISNIEFMNCVHPLLFARSTNPPARKLLAKLVEKIVRKLVPVHRV